MDESKGSQEKTAGIRKRLGFPVDPHRLQSALWSGRRWLIGAVVLGALVGFVFAKVLMGHTYETTAVLRYEGDPKIAGVEFSGGYPLGPAADALRSESFLRQLKERIEYRGSLITLRNSIGYQLDYRAGTLRVTVVAPTAQGAADFAHEVTDVFLTYHRERQARRIEEEIARIAKRIEGAEEEAAEARQTYNEFRERHGIASLSTEQQSMVDSAAKLRADSELAAAEIRALEAQVSSLEEQLADTPRTSVVAGTSSPARLTYERLSQELAAARASLSADHPRVQALQFQVNQLRAELRGGGGEGIVGSNATYQVLSDELREAKSTLTTLKERQKGLAQLAERAQRRLESFSGVEGEASALLAEVEVNEALVGRLHATEAALEDALEHPPSGFSVLDPGAAPEYPVENKRKRVVFASVVMMSVLPVLLLVLRREFKGLTAQTPAEVAFWGHGPVLGATAWPNDPLGLDELVAGLDDLAPDATGELLIIGGAPGDDTLARELTRRMSDDWFVDRPAPRERSAAHRTQDPSPLQTPPPSGPYPIGGSHRPSAAPAQASTALALRPVQLVRREKGLRLQAWDGPFEDQALRRAARLADRVVVLVRSGGMTALALNGVRRRIGRDSGFGYILLGLPERLRTLPDRVGDVRQFWQN